LRKAFQVLTQLDLGDNRAVAAADGRQRALPLDLANMALLSRTRAIAAKLAQKAQPLPKQ
jgi:hypothetical protein